jgi:hypothetical protein
MNALIDETGNIFKSPDVYIKDTGTQKGRGVFAAKNFKPDDIIEECPVVLFRAPFVPPDEMKRVIFSWLALTKGNDGNIFALALGCGSMYNHDNPANMKYEANVTNKTLKFIATRAITANEELTINYNALSGNAESSDDNWFDRMKEPLIKND